MLDAVSDERPGPLDRMRDPDADPAREERRPIVLVSEASSCLAAGTAF